MDITDNIRQIRQAKGITQSELARRIDIERGNYSRIENKGDKLTIEQASKIAQALGVSLIELLTWGEEKETQEPVVDEIQKQKNYIIQLQRERIEDKDEKIGEISRGALRAIFEAAWDEFLDTQDAEGNFLYDWDEDPETNEMYVKYNYPDWEKFFKTYVRDSDLVVRLMVHSVVDVKDLATQNTEFLDAFPKSLGFFDPSYNNPEMVQSEVKARKYIRKIHMKSKKRFSPKREGND